MICNKSNRKIKTLFKAFADVDKENTRFAGKSRITLNSFISGAIIIFNKCLFE
jgi:hypothetical protein